MKKDWLFTNESNICGFRSAGVLIRDDKILVQREKNSNEYSLPGGHVIIGETSWEAITREFKEETGADIVCNRMIWIDESFWKWGKRDAHTVAFYYLISLKDNSAIPDDGEFFSQKDNCNVILKWIALKELSKIKIYPTFIMNEINNLNDSIKHFIYKE